MKLWQNTDHTSKLSLRPELKMRWANPGDAYYTTANEKDYIAQIGVAVLLRWQCAAASRAGDRGVHAPRRHPRRRHPPPPPPPPQPPLDSDHDGVPDSIDQCPNTPLGVLVDACGLSRFRSRGSITLLGVNFDLQ